MQNKTVPVDREKLPQSPGLTTGRGSWHTGGRSAGSHQNEDSDEVMVEVGEAQELTGSSRMGPLTHSPDLSLNHCHASRTNHITQQLEDGPLTFLSFYKQVVFMEPFQHLSYVVNMLLRGRRVQQNINVNLKPVKPPKT